MILVFFVARQPLSQSSLNVKTTKAQGFTSLVIFGTQGNGEDLNISVNWSYHYQEWLGGSECHTCSSAHTQYHDHDLNLLFVKHKTIKEDPAPQAYVYFNLCG